MRIENVRSIKNFRIFQNWSPSSDFTGFSDINLIYANNGTGKSTLASLLSPAQSPDAWEAGVSVEVSGKGITETRTVVSSEDAFWDRMSVFNKDYVADCFDFSVGEAKALLAIGKANANREKELRAARTRLDDLSRLTDSLTKEAKRKQALPNAILKSIGTLVTSTLGGVDGYGRGYDARNVLKRLPFAMPLEERSDFRTEEEIAKAQSTFLKEVDIPLISAIEPLSCSTISGVFERIPTARVIDTLAAHPERAAWVQQGLDLHNHEHVCLFCTGELSQERLEALNRHFDSSSRELQNDLRLLGKQLEALVASLGKLHALFPESGLLYPEFRTEYDLLRSSLKIQIQIDLSELEKLREFLERKQQHLHAAAPLPESWRTKSFSIPDVRPLKKLLATHNDRSTRFEAVRKSACQSLEAFWIGEQQETYMAALHDADAAAMAVEDNAKAIKDTRRVITELENAELDPAPPAEWLNHRLQTLLGRSDLRVEPVEGNRYAIYRHGEPALHLSEGECTALALLYFVRSLNTGGRSRRDQIIVIDDPVSSLDENFTVGASSLLWSELVQPSICSCGAPLDCSCGQKPTRDCGQVFLMTHNFELFRIWSNQLDRLQSSVMKQGRRFKILELQAQGRRVEVGVARRVPVWRDWGSDQNKEHKALRTRLRSEYHYLFWRAASTLISCQGEPTIEHEMDAAIILPNICRRMLEGFLSFKFPALMGDFRLQMQAAIDQVDDGLTRQRLVTYLHQYSHQERVETTRGVNRPEAVSVLHAVFELMRNHDSKHFMDMCTALELDAVLLASRAPNSGSSLEAAIA
ncbi:AAA family ATPase [Arthrobacter bambusae]|uniref:AAA family ATPase n=1 Tax=Arthrobacter bambusae TaxID=1338426 RepID=UPI001F50BBC1|nr:AAA family ATPase [Arthrobacter bambusae]MCI0142085.1 AAA family ATPase [Arthrobacter bambusae]